MSEAVVSSASVLRVTRFAVPVQGSTIDAALRDAMLTFIAEPGLNGAWVGRRTTGATEERVLVSVWGSGDEDGTALWMPQRLGLEGVLHEPERMALPIVFDVRASRPVAPTVLRLYEGRTLPGRLDHYVEIAREASERDLAGSDGPLAVCMALARPDGFVTASVWADWASVEAYTGGDISRPLLSRDTALLAGGDPTHFEIIASG